LEKVRCNDLEWFMINEKRARRTVEGEGIDFDIFVKYMISQGGVVWND